MQGKRTKFPELVGYVRALRWHGIKRSLQLIRLSQDQRCQLCGWWWVGRQHVRVLDPCGAHALHQLPIPRRTKNWCVGGSRITTHH